MHYPFLKKTIKKVSLAISVIIIFSSLLFAQEQSTDTGPVKPINSARKKKGTSLFKIDPSATETQSPGDTFVKEYEKNLSQFQEQARFYREEGIAFQRAGNLEAALSFYQKAIALDPHYAVVYNDLGVIYEAMGFPERAEDAYLKAIKTDPSFLSAYSNLALLYENKRDLKKAEYYWSKRAELGGLDDPWTQKAKQRLRDMQSLRTGISAAQLSREEAVLDMVKETVKQKTAYRGSEDEVFRSHFELAQSCYEKGEEVKALREAMIAKQLQPENSEVDALIEKVNKRLLAK